MKANVFRVIQENDAAIYTASQLNMAIRSRYSVERKRHLELESNTASVKRLKRRANTRRHAAYMTRLKIAREQNHYVQEMMAASAEDMSDLESDGEGTFIVKRPKWRTEAFQNIINDLDLHTNKRMKRMVGTPSKRTK